VSEATPEAIAQWMADRLQQQDRLYQRKTVHEIAEKFGDEFTYRNKNGNLAIDQRILKAFRSASGDTVVWSRWGYFWRKREPGDATSRKQG
jgi:hypothetical protein